MAANPVNTRFNTRSIHGSQGGKTTHKSTQVDHCFERLKLADACIVPNPFGTTMPENFALPPIRLVVAVMTCPFAVIRSETAVLSAKPVPFTVTSMGPVLLN